MVRAEYLDLLPQEGGLLGAARSLYSGELYLAAVIALSLAIVIFTIVFLRSRKLQERQFLVLGIVLVFAFFIRLPGVPAGLINFDVFEPDELQHVAIAKNTINAWDEELVPDDLKTPGGNAPGFGIQLGILSYPLLKVLGLPLFYLQFFGRLLSLAYGLALIALVYVVARNITQSTQAAYFAGLLLAVFDLNITYSHYSVPEVAHAFWAFLAVYMLYKYTQETSFTVLAAAAFSSTMAFLIRLDVAPFVLFGAVLVLRVVREREFRSASKAGLTFVLLSTIFFCIATGFTISGEDVSAIINFMIHGPLNDIPQDTSLLHNPIVYFFAIIAGTSIPAILACIAGARRLYEHSQRRWLYLALCYLAVYFCLIWRLDATFPRRVNVFLPFIAVFAGFALTLLLQRQLTPWKWMNKALCCTFIVYTLGISIVSQYYFVEDTRYRALGYLDEQNLLSSDLAFDMYSKLFVYEGKLLRESESPEVLVLHETYYGRYWKYFPTPFRVPRCCDQVYHCTHQDCHLIQGLFRGENDDFELVVEFKVWNPFPERMVFKKLFGTYETFLGDTLIYRRRIVEDV